MTIKELEDYCHEKADKHYPTDSNARECFIQGFAEAVRLLVLNNSKEETSLPKQERCINKYMITSSTNVPFSLAVACYSKYNCENCSYFKESK